MKDETEENEMNYEYVIIRWMQNERYNEGEWNKWKNGIIGWMQNERWNRGE